MNDWCSLSRAAFVRNPGEITGKGPGQGLGLSEPYHVQANMDKRAPLLTKGEQNRDGVSQTNPCCYWGPPSLEMETASEAGRWGGRGCRSTVRVGAEKGRSGISKAFREAEGQAITGRS